MTPETKKRLSKEIIIFWISLGMMFLFYFFAVIGNDINYAQKEKAHDAYVQKLNSPEAKAKEKRWRTEREQKYDDLEQQLFHFFDSLQNFGRARKDFKRFSLFS